MAGYRSANYASSNLRRHESIMTPPDPQVVVTVKLAQALVDYLKTRPFVEVADLVNGLVQAPRAEIQLPLPAATIPTKEGKNRP